MEKEIPRVYFKEEQKSHIEVMSFNELFNSLKQTKNHDPFTVHKIEFYLILIVTKNSYTHFVDFKSYKLTTGSALFVAKNQVHYFTKELQQSDGFCIIFSSLFTDNNHFLSSNLQLNRLFNYHIETPVIHQQEMGKENLIDITNKLYNEYTHPNDFAKLDIMRALLQVLFLKAERAKEHQSIYSVKNHWLETFNKFKTLLEKEYTTSRNSRLYASKLFISYKLLNDIIKKLTGKTAKAFIDDFVTIEIKRYLVSTSLSIKEISYQTGFEEPSNMVKFFKKNANTTPLKFRNK